MTKFVKTKFEKSGDCLRYEGKFVARFKYSTAPVSPEMFKRILCKCYTQEDYFTRLDAGEAPIKILMNDEIVTFDFATKKIEVNI